MRWQENFRGALTLNRDTFVALRGRSDVFFQGFVVLLVAGLIAGLFGAILPSIDGVVSLSSKEQTQAEQLAGFERNYNGPPEWRPFISGMISESISMGYEIQALPPQAGDWARPVTAVLDYIGAVLATPFSFAFVGWTLFAGLLFQLSSRLLGGRASINQMLGLTALAAAPQVFTAITSLLALLAVATGITLLSGLNGVLGLIFLVWSAAIYIRATAVAQRFSTGRTLGAIALGFVILIGFCLLVVILLGSAIGLFLLPIVSRAL